MRRIGTWIGVLSAVSFCWACGARSGLLEAEGDAASCFPETLVNRSGDRCWVNLKVLNVVRSTGGCYVDAVVSSGQAGTLEFPCGSGAIEIKFGNNTFFGRVSGCQVEASHHTEFFWPSDKCMWESSQRITGSLTSDALKYTYTEQPKAGQSGCLWSCSAEATIKFVAP